MEKTMTLEYWNDGEWHVGHLLECPEVISQGRTLSELEENIRDAYALMRSLPSDEDSDNSHPRRKFLVLQD